MTWLLAWIVQNAVAIAAVGAVASKVIAIETDGRAKIIVKVV